MLSVAGVYERAPAGFLATSPLSGSGKLEFEERIFMTKKKEWIYLIVGFWGAMLGLFGVVLFNQFVLMSLSLDNMK